MSTFGIIVCIAIAAVVVIGIYRSLTNGGGGGPSGGTGGRGGRGNGTLPN